MRIDRGRLFFIFFVIVGLGVKFKVIFKFLALLSIIIRSADFCKWSVGSMGARSAPHFAF